MHTLTLKSVPDDLYAHLKEMARRNKRSLNKEALLRIEQTLCSRPRDAETVLREIREMRKEMNLPRMTQAFINAAKKEGRA